MIRCILSGLAGVAILAAYAYATITHTEADQASQALIWASTGGLVVGAVMVARTKSAMRLLIIPFVLCGEGYASWQTFERVLDTREAKASVGRAQQTALDAGQDRLAKAVSDVEAARKAVTDSAPLKDCKVNCKALLQDAVDAAMGELRSARTSLDSLPVPQVSDVSASQTGIAAWKISLAMAVMLALSTNGLGAALVGVAAHDWPTPVAKPVRTAVEQSEPIVDFRPVIVVSDEPAPDRPGNSPVRTDKQKALSELIGMLADGRTIPSQEHLADHWNRPKQTVSDWLREWRRIGVIPSETRVGRCKATVPA